MKNAIKKLKITPCTSTRTGEAVKNQYVISMPGVYAFQSYDSLIAVYDIDLQQLTLGKHYNYSVTTSKYLWQFVREYCYSIYRQLPDGRSGKDVLNKAIDQGIILFDPNMI